MGGDCGVQSRFCVKTNPGYVRLSDFRGKVGAVTTDLPVTEFVHEKQKILIV